MVSNRIKAGIALLFLSGALSLLNADMATTVKITHSSIAYRLQDENLDLTDFSQAGVNFKSKNTTNVKGELELAAFISDRVVLTLPRAYLKVRFPWFDLTAGKTRVSWGEGFAFNAGDVLFESMSPVLNLTSNVLLDQTAILTALTTHLDTFTFLEGIALPGTATLEYPPGSNIYIPAGIDITTLSGGGRFVAKVWEVFCEAGYLYRGTTRTHNPYVSLHSALFDFLDFYMAGTLSIIHDNANEEAIRNSMKASFGMFKIISLGSEQSLTVRMEAGLYPFAEWQELETPGPGTVYGLYLFPELSLALPEKTGIQLRSLVSPVDGSGIILGGINWNPIQGFNLNLLLSCMFGDENDQYGWGRDRDIAVILNLEYLFGQ